MMTSDVPGPVSWSGPGFQKLVAEVCTGEVGAIFCIEASRLARNGRDWHHLIELCGMTGAVVVGPDGVYDPSLINDRLLLGLKGTMSEFELNLFRQRSFEAIRQKARRGELKFCLPIGFVWSETGKVEMDPDRRVRQAVHLVFAKMTELGSCVRCCFGSVARESVYLPRLKDQDTTLPGSFPCTTRSGIWCRIPCMPGLMCLERPSHVPR